jgi:hypothetical protein
MRGEGRLREPAQVLLDQVAQRPGPGRGGTPARGGGLDRPPSLGGEVAGSLQGGQGDVQVPGREGLASLVGGLGDGGDGPGRLGGDGRVRPRLGAGVRLLVPGGAACGAGSGWPESAVLPAGAAAGCPSPGVLAPGVAAGWATSARTAGAVAGVQVSAMPGRLPLTRVAVPFFSCLPGGSGADPGAGGDHRDGRPGGLGRQRGQDGRCGAVVRRRGKGARGPGPSRRRRRCGPRAGRGSWCVP